MFADLREGVDLEELLMIEGPGSVNPISALPYDLRNQVGQISLALSMGKMLGFSESLSFESVTENLPLFFDDYINQFSYNGPKEKESRVITSESYTFMRYTDAYNLRVHELHEAFLQVSGNPDTQKIDALHALFSEIGKEIDCIVRGFLSESDQTEEKVGELSADKMRYNRLSSDVQDDYSKISMRVGTLSDNAAQWFAVAKLSQEVNDPLQYLSFNVIGDLSKTPTNIEGNIKNQYETIVDEFFTLKPHERVSKVGEYATQVKELLK